MKELICVAKTLTDKIEKTKNNIMYIINEITWVIIHPKKHHNPLYSLWNFGKIYTYHRVKK